MTKFFIEIGTSDFDTLIPLAKKGWKGIFVEPVKYLLDNLERIDGCIYENVAISNNNGETTINYAKNPKHQWQRGIGYTTRRRDSFLPYHYEPHNPSNHFWDNKFANIEKDVVETMTLDTLIDKHDVKDIDFLKIDIEGMEYVVLDTYSWKIKPKLLKIETNWVYTVEDTLEVKNKGLLSYWTQRLEELGYLIYKEEHDWYCILG